MSKINAFGFAFLSFVIGFKYLATLSRPIRSKTKTDRDLLQAISRAWRRLHVFALSSGLLVSVVIGRNNNFILFFTTLN